MRLAHRTIFSLLLCMACLAQVGCEKVSEFADQAKQKVNDLSSDKPPSTDTTTTTDQPPSEGSTTTTPPTTENITDAQPPAVPQPQPAAPAPKTLIAGFLGILPEKYVDSDFQKLADLAPDDLAAIEEIKVSTENVTPAGLQVALKFPALKRLSLTNFLLSPAMLEVVAEMDGLEELSLEFCTIPDEALHKLAPLVQLKSLNLHKAQISDAGLTVLPQLAGLEVLNLSETNATGAGLLNKPKLAKLRVLNVTSSAFGVGLPAFKGIDSIEEILGDLSQINEAALQRSGDWPNLKSIYLQRCQIGDNSVMLALRGSKKLETVSLKGTQISNRTFGVLQHCKQLRLVDAQETTVNATGGQALQKILPQAGIIW